MGNMSSETPVCKVCEKSTQGKTLSCGHVFHVECIDPWLSDKGNCPICRRSFNSALTTTAVETKECSICLDVIAGVYALTCGHVFHTPCLRQRRDCPQCGSRFQEISFPKCVMCSLELASEEAKLPCGHVYHESCVASWVKEVNSCPACFSPVDPRKPSRIPDKCSICLQNIVGKVKKLICGHNSHENCSLDGAVDMCGECLSISTALEEIRQRPLCFLCSEVLTSDIQKFPCGHKFHKGCASSWLENELWCPECAVSNSPPEEVARTNVVPTPTDRVREQMRMEPSTPPLTSETIRSNPPVPHTTAREQQTPPTILSGQTDIPTRVSRAATPPPSYPISHQVVSPHLHLSSPYDGSPYFLSETAFRSQVFNRTACSIEKTTDIPQDTYRNIGLRRDDPQADIDHRSPSAPTTSNEAKETSVLTADECPNVDGRSTRSRTIRNSINRPRPRSQSVKRNRQKLSPSNDDAYDKSDTRTQRLDVGRPGSVAQSGRNPAAACRYCRKEIAQGMMRLSCGHEFHSSCISVWLEVNKSCIVCGQVCEEPVSEDENEALRREVEELRLKERQRERRLEQMEEEHRKKNLIFKGVRSYGPDSYGEVIRHFCGEILCVDVENLVESVIAVGRQRPDNPTLKVVFKSCQSATEVLNRCKRLKGTEYSVSRDYSKVVRARRSKLLHCRYKIIQKTQLKSVSVRDEVLFVDNRKFIWDDEKGLVAKDNKNDEAFLELLVGDETWTHIKNLAALN